jgi:hypothetical protein
VTHTYRWFDGFEQQGDVITECRAYSVTGTPVVELTIVRNSRASVKFNANNQNFMYYAAGFTGPGKWDTAGAGPGANHWAACHFRLDTNPGAQVTIAQFSAAGALVRSTLRIESTGKMRIYNEGGAAFAETALALTLGKWYTVSYHFDQNTTQEAIIRDADTGATFATISVAENSGAGPTTLHIGILGNANGIVFYVDNLVEEADATAANIDDPINDLTVAYACGMLLPDSVGFYNVWTNDYTYVDEAPSDGDTTYRQAAASGAFTQGLAATSSLAAQVAVIKAAIGWALWRSTGGQTNNANIRMRSGATDVNTTGDGTVSGTYIAAHLLRTTDPATSAAWTVSGIDSAEMGAADAGNNSIRVTTCGIDILYSVGAITRTKVIAYVMDDYDPERRVFDARTGEELPYEEVQPNVGWLRVTSGDMPDSSAPADAWEDDTLLPIDSVRYSQDASGASLDIIPSSEGLAEQLIRGLANSSGSL